MYTSVSATTANFTPTNHHSLTDLISTAAVEMAA